MQIDFFQFSSAGLLHGMPSSYPSTITHLLNLWGESVKGVRGGAAGGIVVPADPTTYAKGSALNSGDKHGLSRAQRGYHQV